VELIVPANGTIYVAGHFSIIAGVDQEGLAELDQVTGIPTTWDPQPGPRRADYAPTITALALTEQSIYVGGEFREIGGELRYKLGEIDRGSGAATGWDPRTDVAPSILAVSEDAVFAGGVVAIMGCIERNRLAAFDVITGEPTAWNPNPNGFFASDVAVSGSRVYVAGDFSNVGREDRRGLAALDTLTGMADGWTANTDNVVGKLAIVGDRLLAGGYFTTVGGVPRNRFAAFNLENGELDDLDLNLDSNVYEIHGVGNTAYLGGFFTTVAGQERRYAAAVDIATDSLLDWGPNPDQPVLAIAANDSTVFLGGGFQTIDGAPRRGLAAVTRSTGAVRPDWIADTADDNPSTNRVYDLAIVGSTLYAAGSMNSIGGVSRGGLAAVDAATGTVLDWDPKLGGANVSEPSEPGIPWSLAVSGNTLFVGGLFLWSGALPASTLAGLSTVVDSVPPTGETPAFALSVPFPNPAELTATAQFTLSSATTVDLAIYDVRGRRIESLIRGETKTAGVHQVPFHTSGWPAGFYFCRLEVEGVGQARKFVVIR
jgi:hypothetical protein